MKIVFGPREVNEVQKITHMVNFDAVVFALDDVSLEVLAEIVTIVDGPVDDTDIYGIIRVLFLVIRQ
jgi:hypothetical protein